jgi:hypothetical protein
MYFILLSSGLYRTDNLVLVSEDVGGVYDAVRPSWEDS